MYSLEKSSINDIERIIEYKKKNIYEYATNISKEEKDKITEYICNNISNEINNCKNIIVSNKIIGCVILTNIKDGKLLDEIYIEEEYRNKGIGTDIIKQIIKDNNKVYLWVYKLNTKAISLYKRLGFKEIDNTETRLYMEYKKH